MPIVPKVRFAVKQRLLRHLRRCHSVGLKTRLLIVIKRIRVVLDNDGIHDSRLVAWALLQAGGRIRSHPLPPYGPQHNPIERVWEDLHAEVTRNHTCPDMEALMIEVRLYLLRRYWRILDQAAEDNPQTKAS